MECITKSTLLSLLGGECFGRLEIEVVIKMQVVELLTVDEQIEHVVPLTTNLQPDLHPIQLCALKEFGRLETFEEDLFVLFDIRARVKLIENPILQQLLVRDTDFGWIIQFTGDTFSCQCPIRGTSIVRRVRLDLMWNGRGAK